MKLCYDSFCQVLGLQDYDAGAELGSSLELFEMYKSIEALEVRALLSYIQKTAVTNKLIEQLAVSIENRKLGDIRSILDEMSDQCQHSECKEVLELMNALDLSGGTHTSKNVSWYYVDSVDGFIYQERKL